MTQAGTEVSKEAGGAPDSVEGSSRVCCISCGRTLMEISVETPKGSRVWIKAKCRDCKGFNVIVMKDGRLNVSAVV
jgi:phage FluMu protein Com